MRRTLRDLLEFRAPSKVDRLPSGELVIRSVKFLGNRSSNRNADGTHNVYPLKTRKAALGLYEGAPVYLNHRQPKSKAPRGYDEKLGRLRNVKALENGSVGDLHLNPKHPQAEQVAWDAAHSPDSVGLSHDAAGAGRVEGSDCLIEEIYHVSSVDVVDAGATTRSLFEARQVDAGRSLPAMMATLLRKHRHLAEGADEGQLLAVLTDEDADPGERVRRALALIAKARLGGAEEAPADPEPTQEARRPLPPLPPRPDAKPRLRFEPVCEEEEALLLEFLHGEADEDDLHDLREARHRSQEARREALRRGELPAERVGGFLTGDEDLFDAIQLEEFKLMDEERRRSARARGEIVDVGRYLLEDD